MRIVIVVVFAVSVVMLLGAVAKVAGGRGDGGGSTGAASLTASAAAEPDSTPAEVARAMALDIAKDVTRKITPEMAAAHKRLVKRGARKGEAYRLWQDFLDRLRVRYGVTSLYTMVRLDRTTAGVVVESAEDPEDADRWLAAYEMERAMKRAFGGRAMASRAEPWFDPRIRGGAPHVRALAPIRDGADKVVAIVGVDVEVGDQRVAR